MMAKILIVDDQACVRELLSEELISDGYRVATAGDAESISGHMRFSEPDLVLLDLYLDGAEGFRILRDIKGQNPDLPVIIFTAYDSYWEDPRLSQADGYVIKSIDLGELKGKIADVLSRKPAPQELEVKTHFPESSMAYG
ncbi:MAG: response regulator [Deltaproteobacteria bacterium]|nr:response regulator [Deltaproteobacteria bacterium]